MDMVSQSNHNNNNSNGNPKRNTNSNANMNLNKVIVSNVNRAYITKSAKNQGVIFRILCLFFLHFYSLWLFFHFLCLMFFSESIVYAFSTFFMHFCTIATCRICEDNAGKYINFKDLKDSKPCIRDLKDEIITEMECHM